MAVKRIAFLILAGAVAGAAAPPKACGPLLGINMAGGETATKFMPGRLGYNYMYPTPAEVDLAYRKGVRLFRLPLAEDRVQDGIMGPLRPEVAQVLYPVVDYMLAKPGAVVLIDWHSFGKRGEVPYGVEPWSVRAIVDLNMKFFARYRSTRNLWLGLQNEPKGAGAAWWSTAQAVVQELRKAGFTQQLVIGGDGYSAASGWTRANGPAAAHFHDPAGQPIFEAHSYFDKTGAGISRDCVVGAEHRLDPVLDDAAANGYKLIFGEIAFGAGTNCAEVRQAAIARIKASPNVVGVAFWAWGRFYRYPHYLFGLMEYEVVSPLFEQIEEEWGKDGAGLCRARTLSRSGKSS